MPLVTGKKPSQLIAPTAAVDNNGWLVFELPNGEVVKIHPSQLPGGSGGGVTTTFNNETGSNAPLSPTSPATVPTGAAASDTVVEFYDDKILYWTFDGVNWTLNSTQVITGGGSDNYVISAGLNANILTLTLQDSSTVQVDLSSLAGGSGTSLSIYDAGLGFIVKGTTGITVTSGSQGVYAIDIPAGGLLESFQKQFTNAGTEFTPGGEIQLNIDWNTGAFNTSYADAILPNIKMILANNNQAEPASFSVTVQHTSVAAGVSATSIANINGVGTPVRLKGII